MTSKETIKSNGSANKSKETNNLVNDTKQELAKVVWPSRQQLLSESVAVMLMVTLVATVVYLVDQLFGFIAGKVF